MARRKPVPENRGLLLSHVEALEALVLRKAEIAAEFSLRMRDAKSDGFDPWAIRAMLKERRLTAEQRREARAILDVYRAALGILDGTPLGDDAKRRLARPTEDAADDEVGDDAPDASEVEPQRDLQQQRLTATAEGAAAAKAGKKVLENPYHGSDPRRAAWDEGWCAASASDGMDIPAAWRRSKPKKPDGKGKAA